jgi:hypothetical protein
VVAFAIVGALIAGDTARAQSAGGTLRLRPLTADGASLFLAPHAATRLGGFLVGAQAELGWGEAAAWSGAGRFGWEPIDGLLLTANVRRGSADGRGIDRDDGAIGLTVEGARAGLSVAYHSLETRFEENSGRLRGTELRAWGELGRWLELGVSMRTGTVAEQGVVTDRRRYVVTGYEFVATDRRNFLYIADRRDLEAHMTATLGGIRLTAVAGRALADQVVSTRSWAWGGVALPIGRDMELLAEAGRNEGGGLVTHEQGRFVRLGLRVDMVGSRRPGPLPPPMPVIAAATAVIDVSHDGPRLVVRAPDSDRIEVMGDFTAWQAKTMSRSADGQWTFPVHAGVLRFNIRIDGGTWTVPAGVSVVADEFSGAPVAVVVVR